MEIPNLGFSGKGDSYWKAPFLGVVCFLGVLFLPWFSGKWRTFWKVVTVGVYTHFWLNHDYGRKCKSPPFTTMFYGFYQGKSNFSPDYPSVHIYISTLTCFYGLGSHGIHRHLSPPLGSLDFWFGWCGHPWDTLGIHGANVCFKRPAVQLW